MRPKALNYAPLKFAKCRVKKHRHNSLLLTLSILSQQRGFETFLEVNDVDIAGIEFVTDVNGHSYAYDVNTNTNYNPDAEKIVAEMRQRQSRNFLITELDRQLHTAR